MRSNKDEKIQENKDGKDRDYHWGRNYYRSYSEKIKSCKETGLHYSNYFPHSTETKTATVTEIFVPSKEKQHQSLHYST